MSAGGEGGSLPEGNGQDQEVVMLPAPGFDPIRLVLRRLRFVVLVVAVGIPLAILHAQLAPKWYLAHVTIVPVDNARAGANLFADLPIDLGVGHDDGEKISEMIKSRSVADAVMAGARLGGDPNEAREELWKHCSVRTERESGFLTLTCDGKDAQQVRQVLAQFVLAAQQTWRRVDR